MKKFLLTALLVLTLVAVTAVGLLPAMSGNGAAAGMIDAQTLKLAAFNAAGSTDSDVGANWAASGITGATISSTYVPENAGNMSVLYANNGVAFTADTLPAGAVAITSSEDWETKVTGPGVYVLLADITVSTTKSFDSSSQGAADAYRWDVTVYGNGHTVTLKCSMFNSVVNSEFYDMKLVPHADGYNSTVVYGGEGPLVEYGRGITCGNIWNTINVNAPSNSYVGGIVGTNGASGNVIFDRCRNDGTIQGQTGVGGLIGCAMAQVTGSKTETVTVKNSVNYGNIFARDTVAAGLVGFARMISEAAAPGTIVIENCVNNGSISSAKNSAAGIIWSATNNLGDDTQKTIVTIKNVVNNGHVYGNAAQNASGILGALGHGAGSATQSASAPVTGDLYGCFDLVMENVLNTGHVSARWATGIGPARGALNNYTYTNVTNAGSIEDATGAGCASGFIGNIGNKGQTSVISFTNCVNAGPCFSARNGAGFITFAQIGKGSITFTNCENSGATYGGTQGAGGFISSVNATALGVPTTFVNCVNAGVYASPTAIKAPFFGQVGKTTVLSQTNCIDVTNPANEVAYTSVGSTIMADLAVQAGDMDRLYAPITAEQAAALGYTTISSSEEWAEKATAAGTFVLLADISVDTTLSMDGARYGVTVFGNGHTVTLSTSMFSSLEPAKFYDLKLVAAAGGFTATANYNGVEAPLVEYARGGFFYNIWNTVAVTSTAGTVGGIAGQTGANTYTIFEGCKNDAAISGGSQAGGLIGGSMTNGANKGYVKFTNCVNNGAVSGTFPAGFTSYVRAVNMTTGVVAFYNSVNNGTITGKTAASGIMGTAITQGAITAANEATFAFNNVVNNGKVTVPGNNKAAGIFGSIAANGGKAEWGDVGNTVRLYTYNTLNAGELDSRWVAGIGPVNGAGLSFVYVDTTNAGTLTGRDATGSVAGFVSNFDDAMDAYKPVFVFLNSKNTGTISQDCRLAGFVGLMMSTAATVDFINCVNSGTITPDSGNNGSGGFICTGNGVIAGNNTQVSFTNCTNSGNIGDGVAINGAGFAGNPVGMHLTFTDCLNSGAVNAKTRAGGFVGHSQDDVVMTNCVNTGKLTGAYAGGMISQLYATSNAALSECVNLGELQATSYAGGMVAQIANICTLNADACINMGEIVAAGEAGGIVGRSDTAAERVAITITNCMAVADVTSTGSFAGGITANLDAKTLTIKNNMVGGNISGVKGAAAITVKTDGTETLVVENNLFMGALEAGEGYNAAFITDATVDTANYSVMDLEGATTVGVSAIVNGNVVAKLNANEANTWEQFLTCEGFHFPIPTAVEPLYAPMHVYNHNYENVAYDAEGHWVGCLCGAVEGEGEIVKTPHTAKEGYAYDAGYHYTECEGCAYLMNETKCEGSAPTCTEDGICSTCGGVSEKATGHDMKTVEGQAPTCTTAGFKAYQQCEVCGTIEGYEEIEATGHDMQAVEGKAPTCTEGGWTAYTKCSVCDYTEGYEVLEPNGHSIVNVDAQAPTCTEGGWDAYEYCTECDYTTKVEKDALGHNLVDVDEVPATCTEPGATAHKACDRCNEYTEGKEVIEATGHDWSNADGVCANGCGETCAHENMGEGACPDCGYVAPVDPTPDPTPVLVYDEALGAWTCEVEGVKQTGWVEIDGVYYHFAKDYKATTGTKLMGDVYFTFAENGATTGVWGKTFNQGTRYYYGPDYYKATWAEIDGQTYYFGADGARFENVCNVDGVWYVFEAEGALVGKADGIHELDGALHGFIDGAFAPSALYKTEDGMYYFVKEDGKLAVSERVTVEVTACDLPAASYLFDENGAMVGASATGEVVSIDDVLYLYKNGQPMELGLYEIDGAFYYAFADGKVAVNTKVAVTVTHCSMKTGTYVFGADGKMMVTGIVEVDGALYYYENGVGTQKNFFEYEGKLYYAVYGGKLVRSKSVNVLPSVNNTTHANGWYEFGDDGAALHGIIDKDGVLYYYEYGKGVQKGLLEYDGLYYYSVYAGKIARNVMINTARGWMEFGDDGAALHGIIEKNGALYYYEHGQGIQKNLFQHTDGYYYYAVYAGKLVRNVMLNTTRDWMEFGDDGRALDGIIEKNGALYYYEHGRGMEKGYMEYQGKWYFTSFAGKIACNTSINLNGAWRDFGADGARLDGIVTKNGALYYYEEGVGVQKNLFEYEGHYYYSVFGGKLVAGKSLAVQQTNNVLIVGTYIFDEMGRIVG